jgi:RecB family endonuclease NucS
MSKYDRLTVELETREEAQVILTFDELDSIVGSLPASARQYPEWWTNNAGSQPHARAWLNAGRRASPDFESSRAVFTKVSEEAEEVLAPIANAEQQAVLASYAESSLSFEKDLEDHLIGNLESLEPGLQFLGRQVNVDVGRIDILARSSAGETVVVELKVGEAREAAVGQTSKYIGWYARSEGKRPRAILVAASFTEAARYAADAVPGLRLATYKVQFSFETANL